MPKISVVIISYNEEDCIERCILSVQSVADDILVLDSFSKDGTGAICKRLGVRFIQQSFKGYRDQKNDALLHAKYDHVLSLDADEALSEELCNSILEVKSNWNFDAYYCKRLNNFYGQWLSYSNWYPDKKIRLFDRRKGKWGGYNLHETVQMNKDARVSLLSGDLLHWVFDNYDEHLNKANSYSTIGASEYFKAGRRANAFSPILHSIWIFIKSFLLRKGYKDGFNGFVVCSISSYTCFLKYIKLRRLCIGEKDKTNDNFKIHKVEFA